MKPSVREVIVVEGRYDKNALLQVVDALVITTEGFAIFKDGEKKTLIKRLAQERGLVILTDGDGAGFLIRNHLKGVLPQNGVKHAYIPDRHGKERRKRMAGKEGKLGVEGMPPEALLTALRQAGVTFGRSGEARQPWLTKADLMRDGLCGVPDSAARRAALIKRLSLPEHLTANGLLDVLNILCGREEYEQLVRGL